MNKGCETMKPKAKNRVKVGKVSAISVFLLIIIVCGKTAVSSQSQATWNPKWTKHQTVMVQETAGLDRSKEPVEVEIKFWQPDKGDFKKIEADVKREIRVIHHAEDGKYTEIPSQVYGVGIDKWHKSKTESQAVMVRAQVVFQADVKAYKTEKYQIYYGNPEAGEPRYETPLKVKGTGVHYTIENSFYRIMTEKTSGQIEQIDFKFAGKPSLRFNPGTIHWNPGFVQIPDDFPSTMYTWLYAHNFKNPATEIELGPVFFSIKRSQLIPGQDIVFMEVYYRFYRDLPYFVMESRIEAKKDTRAFVIRNDEMGFRSEDFTHAGWRDKTPEMLKGDDGHIGTSKLFHELRECKTSYHTLAMTLPPNMAWISFVNLQRSFGVGSIRLDFCNENVLTGAPSPLYKSHTVISEHGGSLYWFRGLIYSKRRPENRSREEMDEFAFRIPRGTSYYEKNDYLLYEFDMEKKFSDIDHYYFRLREPLRVVLIRTEKDMF